MQVFFILFSVHFAVYQYINSKYLYRTHVIYHLVIYHVTFILTSSYLVTFSKASAKVRLFFDICKKLGNFLHYKSFLQTTDCKNGVKF